MIMYVLTYTYSVQMQVQVWKPYARACVSVFLSNRYAELNKVVNKNNYSSFIR